MEVFEERPVQKLMKTNNRNYNLIKQKLTLSLKQLRRTQNKWEMLHYLYLWCNFATRKRVELVPRNLRVFNVSVTYEGGVYKYMFGEPQIIMKQKKYLSEARKM
jgi:hypothetical protein